jgi:hypothetical protein
MKSMDYYAQITEARRLIADYAGSSPFQIKTKTSGHPRWNKTMGWLEVSEQTFTALQRRGLTESYLEEGSWVWRA